MAINVLLMSCSTRMWGMSNGSMNIKEYNENSLGSIINDSN